jgi:hypothetical protein
MVNRKNIHIQFYKALMPMKGGGVDKYGHSSSDEPIDKENQNMNTTAKSTKREPCLQAHLSYLP